MVYIVIIANRIEALKTTPGWNSFRVAFRVWAQYSAWERGYRRVARARERVSNGGQREHKKLLQRSQLRHHGEFRHVSVSERQRSRVCGQNLYGAFVRLYTR